jgi:hypothetical protein
MRSKRSKQWHKRKQMQENERLLNPLRFYWKDRFIRISIWNKLWKLRVEAATPKQEKSNEVQTVRFKRFIDGSA